MVLGRARDAGNQQNLNRGDMVVSMDVRHFPHVMEAGRHNGYRQIQ